MVGHDVPLQRGLDLLEIFQLVLVELVLPEHRHAALVQVVLDTGRNIDAMDMVRMQAAHLGVWRRAVLVLGAHLPFPQFSLQRGDRYFAGNERAAVLAEDQGVFDRGDDPLVFPARDPHEGPDHVELLIGYRAFPFVAAGFAAGVETVLPGDPHHVLVGVAVLSAVPVYYRPPVAGPRFPEFKHHFPLPHISLAELPGLITPARLPRIARGVALLTTFIRALRPRIGTSDTWRNIIDRFFIIRRIPLVVCIQPLFVILQQFGVHGGVADLGDHGVV